MSDYRPFHLPACPARDPAVNVDRLRIDPSMGAWPANIVTERICICPPERFGPGSKPIWEAARA